MQEINTDENLVRLQDLLREIFGIGEVFEQDPFTVLIRQRLDLLQKYIDADMPAQFATATEIAFRALSQSVQERIHLADQAAGQAGISPDVAPASISSRKELADLESRMRSERLQLYRQLYDFFVRYYADGDLIPQRRYKRGTYLLPYEGEEVFFTWATADQYLARTVEHDVLYKFTLSENLRVTISVVPSASIGSEGKRESYFIEMLPGEDALAEKEGELVAKFQAVPRKPKLKQSDLTREAAERIAYYIANQGLSSDTATSILATKIDNFVSSSRQSFFVHKNLGGFLRDEFDRYVYELSKLRSRDPNDQLVSQALLEALESVGRAIIDALSAIEALKLNLLMRPKLVTASGYLVPFGYLSDAQRTLALQCDAQLDRWRADLAISLHDLSQAERVAFLSDRPGAVVDTRLFSKDFEFEILTSLSGEGGLEAKLLGTVVKSENFQALRALLPSWRNQVDAIFIDPPYNTTSEGVLYKNRYEESAWLSLVCDRIRESARLLKDEGSLIVSIDDQEVYRLQLALSNIFGEDNFIGTIVVESNPRGRTIRSHLATSHDYFMIWANDAAELELYEFALSDEQQAEYRAEDANGNPARWLPFRRSGGLSTPEERPNSRYPIYYRETDKVFSLTPMPGSIEIWPNDVQGRERVWRHTKPSFQRDVDNNLVRVSVGRDGSPTIQLLDPIKSGRKAKTVWKSERYDASTHGTVLLQSWFGKRGVFSYPKSLNTMRDILGLQLRGNESGVVLDFFGGSGTTAHALMDLNESTEGRRRFILVETNDYVEDVQLPRISKRMYARNWIAGAADAGSIVERPLGIIEYYELESYEDAVFNAQLRGETATSLIDAFSLTNVVPLDLKDDAIRLSVLGEPIWIYDRKGASQRRPDLLKTFELIRGFTPNQVMWYSGVILKIGRTKDFPRAVLLWREPTVNDDAFAATFEQIERDLGPETIDIAFVNGSAPAFIVERASRWEYVEASLASALVGVATE